jgi:hypothetical protein
MVYQLRDSPFFRLRSKEKLARLLFISCDQLEKLANGEGRYYEFDKAKKSGGTRKISAPIDPLKRVQKRIAVLLQRVTPPDFLFAPVAGRSYVDNATRHVGARAVRLLDIEEFFPSCSVSKVAWLFNNKMECSPDVSAILCKLLTYNGCLPQGSPASPILAYLAYLQMWTEIQELVEGAGCKLSVYADDLTISGDVVPEAMVWKVKQTLHRHGHKHSREKERSRRGRPVEITGVILCADKVSAPNRQHHRIHQIREELRSATLEQAAGLKRKLGGRLAQLAQIRAGNARSAT